MKNGEREKKNRRWDEFSAWSIEALCACGNGYWLQPKRVRRLLATARFGQGQYDSMPE